MSDMIIPRRWRTATLYLCIQIGIMAFSYLVSISKNSGDFLRCLAIIEIMINCIMVAILGIAFVAIHMHTEEDGSSK